MNNYIWVVHGKACGGECTPKKSICDDDDEDWTVCSTQRHHSRLNRQQNWESLYEHSKRKTPITSNRTSNPILKLEITICVIWQASTIGWDIPNSIPPSHRLPGLEIDEVHIIFKVLEFVLFYFAIPESWPSGQGHGIDYQHVCSGTQPLLERKQKSWLLRTASIYLIN